MLKVDREVRKHPRYDDDDDTFQRVLNQLSPAERKRWSQETEVFFELVPEFYPKYGDEMIPYIDELIDEKLGPFSS